MSRAAETGESRPADVAVIGAGVVGTAIARALALQDVSCVLIDAPNDVGTGTSKANTAILHTGFDAVPGSLESRLLRRGYGAVRWLFSPPGLAAIEPGGYLRPVGEGRVSIAAEVSEDGGAAATSEGTIEPRQGRPLDFAEDIVPILTRLGCNTGSCHGKADGQNGFHLSLMGYDSVGDYRQVVRDWGQRRITPLHPETSLFLINDDPFRPICRAW